MFARSAASVVVAASLILGASGCAFITPQATEIHYQPADGVEANVGELALRNFIVVSDDGETGNLVGTIINSGSTNVRLSLQYVTGTGTRVTVPVEVAAGSVTSVGYGTSQQVITHLGIAAGGLMKLYAQYGDEVGEQVDVPVLTTEQSQYATLAPTPVATN